MILKREYCEWLNVNKLENLYEMVKYLKKQPHQNRYTKIENLNISVYTFKIEIDLN